MARVETIDASAAQSSSNDTTIYAKTAKARQKVTKKVSNESKQLGYQDDDGTSERLRKSDISKVVQDDNGNKHVLLGNDKSTKNTTNRIWYNSDEAFKAAKHAANLFDRNDLDPFTRRYRFGYIDPYRTVSTVREYLFFTKPDLNIYPLDDSGSPQSDLSEYLRTQPYWTELSVMHPEVIKELELSLDSSNPFNNLLGNTVMNTLEIPASEAEMIDTPANMYGVSYTYRGSSEASENNPTFSLEFRDTKYLPVYHFFKAYDDYEILKHHGHLPPALKYRRNRILYDQYSIYKFLVDEDGETIIYYGKFYGVKSKSVPRDVFSNTDYSNGLSYSIDFGAAFYDDMKVSILAEFNNLYAPAWQSAKYEYNVHNSILDAPDNRPAKAARVYRMKSSQAPGGFVYKLKWKGDDKI